MKIWNIERITKRWHGDLKWPNAMEICHCKICSIQGCHKTLTHKKYNYLGSTIKWGTVKQVPVGECYPHCTRLLSCPKDEHTEEASTIYDNHRNPVWGMLLDARHCAKGFTSIFPGYPHCTSIRKYLLLIFPLQMEKLK